MLIVTQGPTFLEHCLKTFGHGYRGIQYKSEVCRVLYYIGVDSTSHNAGLFYTFVCTLFPWRFEGANKAVVLYRCYISIGIHSTMRCLCALQCGSLLQELQYHAESRNHGPLQLNFWSATCLMHQWYRVTILVLLTLYAVLLLVGVAIARCDFRLRYL